MAPYQLLKNKILVVANWKMNPTNVSDARKLFSYIKRKNTKTPRTINVICPPVVFLSDLVSGYSGNKFLFGTQDLSLAHESESTGEISADILKSIGVRFVIVGHSERRALGETDEIVGRKAQRAIGADLTPIVCVGELERDVHGKYLRAIEEQLHRSLAYITKSDIKKIVIAYEPVWTIGQGHRAMSAPEVHQTILFIRKILARIYNRRDAMNVPILYGGSVDADNAHEIITLGETQGLLIGRASLNEFVFSDILKALNK